MHHQTFDMGKWLGQLLSTAASFETLTNLAEHPEAAAEFKQSIRVQSFGGTTATSTSGDIDVVKQLRDHVYENALFAVEHYAALMVVTAATYVENMLFEFLSALFNAKPSTMHQYLMGDGSTREAAVVPLQDVLDANDLIELRSSLASRAAKNANGGSVMKVISRIESITKCPIPKSVTGPIVDLTLMRNRIVHEGFQPSRDSAKVKTRYESVSELLTELGRQCQSFGIPYSDPAFIIDEYPPVDDLDGIS